MQREGEFQKAIKRRGERRTHLYDCLIPINVFSPSPTAIFFFFSRCKCAIWAILATGEREGGGGRGKTLCNYEETYFSPSFFPLSVRTAGVSCVGANAKADGGRGGGGGGVRHSTSIHAGTKGRGSAHYNYPPRTFETNVLGREGRCQQRLLQADMSFSHTEHEKKSFLEKTLEWNRKTGGGQRISPKE